jgi:signal transduction histidine kinase
VVKEALNNIVRHADAAEVRLSATMGRNGLTLTIEDDGRGFADQTAAIGADGLRNMDERMREVGGRIEIASAPGSGTRVIITLPWTREITASASNPGATSAPDPGRPLDNVQIP